MPELVSLYSRGAAKRIQKYGLWWPATKDPLSLEMDMVLQGGRWKKRQSEGFAGEGLFYHFKQCITLCWPWVKWHVWADLQLKCYLEYRLIGQMGPASTGKTFIPSACVLMDYYVFPWCTTVLVTSTTRESLEMRILGEIKKLHRDAHNRYEWLPGNLIEGRQRIVTDDRSIAAEGRDFRNGLVGVATKKGQAYQGIEEFVGIKNKRLRMVGDEMSFLPRVFVDSISNLNKNTDFKGVFSGNPKDVTDALGVICEPAAHLGGWDGGMDQQGGTKTWETRFPRGVCIQLVGTDSPNLDGNLGIPLITQKQIDDDIAFYGQDSLQFTMMDLGRMPRGQALRRVITRQMCLKFHAMEEPVWKDSNRIKIAFMDAAYRGVGGDRCVLGFLEFGEEAVGATAEEMVSAIVTQKVTQKSNNQILSLIETMLVPVSSNINEIPEDQIVNFVKEQCEKRNIPPENLYFDSTGRGSLMNAFGRLWPIPTGIEFGGQGSERKVSADIDVICKDYYSKYVTELWFNVSYTIQSGQFRGMTEEMMQEGCFREWGFVGAGRGMKIEVEPKDKMKLKSGRSPDLFDALCCGVEGARRRGFIIKKQHAVQGKRVDRNWKSDLKKRAQEHWHGNQLNYAA
jgi:hypothetical protein